VSGTSGRAPAAAIDVGTNTTRVLLGRVSDDGALERLWTDTAMTRLGARTEADGSLRADAIEAAADVVARFATEARRRGAVEVTAVATAAAREAPNAAALVAAVREAAGLELRIVDGDAEAQLTFAGATGAAGMRTGDEAAVVDVGGGSTEVVVGRVGGELRYARSFRIGSGRLHDRLEASDPPSAEQLDRARGLVDELLAADLPRVAAAVVVGGTATALGQLVGPVLDAGSLERAAGLLAAAPSDQVAREHGLDRERARILPAGLVIVRAVAERLGARVTVGAGGIREGLLLAGGARVPAET
jgi:exopolyphosphatase/guanosine-5'-triphosphate,3'-diphosphate pyrophosphatase